MFGVDVKNTNKLLLGAFMGMLVISLFMPVFIVFGVSPSSSLILFYLAPLTGVLTAYVMTEQKEEKTKKTEAIEEFLGKDVIVHTTDGSFRGRLREMTDRMLILYDASRMDDPNNKMDRIFIEKTDVRRMELGETCL